MTSLVRLAAVISPAGPRRRPGKCRTDLGRSGRQLHRRGEGNRRTLGEEVRTQGGLQLRRDGRSVYPDQPGRALPGVPLGRPGNGKARHRRWLRGVGEPVHLRGRQARPVRQGQGCRDRGADPEGRQVGQDRARQSEFCAVRRRRDRNDEEARRLRKASAQDRARPGTSRRPSSSSRREMPTSDSWPCRRS